MQSFIEVLITIPLKMLLLEVIFAYSMSKFE